MLRQGSVSDLISERVTRDEAYIVITMRRYPRFVNRRYRDEYLTCMSPEKKLFEDWLSAKRAHQDHDGAFKRCHFEERFWIEEEGFEHLARLCALAAKQDVYLICQCATGKKCHREFVLILAKKVLKASVEKPKNEYPVFEKRVEAYLAQKKKNKSAKSA